MNTFLEINNLKKSFNINKNIMTVLENVSFKVEKRDFLCIVGPSGCGKSTLLAQIAGFEKSDSGEILLDHKEMRKPETNRIMVFQDFNQLFPWKNLIKNITFPLKINKIGSSEKERINIAVKYLSMVKLEGFENFYPYQLSGGMKQRAAIARALAIRSEVLLMDEPFGSVDAQSRIELQNLLVQIWRDTGITIIFVTHDIGEAIILSNKIVVMSNAPKNIKKIIPNNLARPRNTSDPAFLTLYNQIFNMIKV